MESKLSFSPYDYEGRKFSHDGMLGYLILTTILLANWGYFSFDVIFRIVGGTGAIAEMSLLSILFAFVGTIIFYSALTYINKFIIIYDGKDLSLMTKLKSGFGFWFLGQILNGVRFYLSAVDGESPALLSIATVGCQLISLILIIIYSVNLKKWGDPDVKKFAQTFLISIILINVLLLGGTVLTALITSRAIVILGAIIAGLIYAYPLFTALQIMKNLEDSTTE